MSRATAASSGPVPPVSQYAPHPGAMSGDVWPMSLEEMAKELSSSPRSRPNSMSGSSPYDNKFEAAAGAAALVNAVHPKPSPRAPPPSASAGSRKTSLPNRTPPVMIPNPTTARQWSEGYGKQSTREAPVPINILGTQTASPSESPALPTVVLTPPDDEPGEPIPLYPRPSPERDYFAPTGPARRIVDAAPIPMPESPPASDVVPSAQSAPTVVRGFRAETKQRDTPIFARNGADAQQVIMPKRPDEVKQGDRFDADFDNLMKDLPSPTRQTGQSNQHNPPPSASRDAPPPPSQSPMPGGHQEDKSASRKSMPASKPQTPNKKANRQTLPASPQKENAKPDGSGKHPRQVSEPTSKPTPKENRRRSLSLSTIFGKRKSKAPAGEVPPMPTTIPPVPPLPSKTPGSESIASTPGGDKAEKKVKRRTLLGKTSLKDLFGASQSQKSAEASHSVTAAPASVPSTPTKTPPAGKMRRSQSKPELRKGLMTPADAPPMPAMPAQVPATQSTSPVVVPDALAALTARSGTKPANANVEFVPDVFAAFSSSTVNPSNVERARAAAPPPAPPMPTGPTPSSAASASVAQKQQFGQSMPNLNEPRETVSAPATPKKGSKDTNAVEEKRERRKSLGKRLSFGLFSKKKAPDTSVPEVPALPPAFERASPAGTANGSVPRSMSKPTPSASKQSKTQAVDGLPSPATNTTATPPLKKGGARPPLPAQMVKEAKEATAQPRQMPQLQQGSQAAQPALRQQPDVQQMAQPQQAQHAPQTQPQAFQPPQTQMQMPQPTIRQHAQGVPLPVQRSYQQAQQFPQQAQSPYPQRHQMPQPHIRQSTQQPPAVHNQPDSPSPDLSAETIGIKPPSPTKPLNIQKRVPVSSGAHPPVLADEAQSDSNLATSTDTPATTSASTPIPSIQTEAPTPTVKPADLPVDPSNTLRTHISPSAPLLRPESEEMASLAYLDGTDSEDNHPDVSGHSSASTIMPSIGQTPTATPPTTTISLPIQDSSRSSPTPGTSPSDTPIEPDPPSPSPSNFSVAEVHTAQTARRSEFRSLSTMEILTIGSDDHGKTLLDLQNVTTEGENQGIAGATAALVAGSAVATSIATTQDAQTQEPARAESFLEIEPPVQSEQSQEQGSGKEKASPSQPLSPITENGLEASQAALVEEPDEMDEQPQGWTTFDPDRSEPVPVVTPVKTISEDLRNLPASEDSHTSAGASQAPSEASTRPQSASPTVGRPVSKNSIPRSPSVLAAIAGTSIGIQPPPPSAIDEALDDAQHAIENAGSYFFSAANRMSRAATGLASAVSSALSPTHSNVELPNSDSPVSESMVSKSRSATADSGAGVSRPECYTSPSVESTATFDTAPGFESAEEGSLDSATFETFETFSTASVKTYTPAVPPPQSSVPDLLENIRQPESSRIRRGSMPASLANTAARRRSTSTPLNYKIPSVDERGPSPSIPHRFENDSPALDAPVRRPYTGRSTTMPSTPTTAQSAQSFASPVGSRRQSSQPFPVGTDSRPDSPLGLRMPGMFNSYETSFVVPFDESTQSPTARSPTIASHYTPTAAARERTRRDSGITSAVGGLGFARKGPIDSVAGVPVQSRTRSNAQIQHDSIIRRSLPTVVDYSVRSSRSSRGSLGPEFAMWSEISGPNIDTVPENAELSTAEPQGEPVTEREPDVEESFQLDNSSCDSSDELDGAPCTPKTPDLDTLANVSPPATREGATTPSASSSRDNTPSKSNGSAHLTRTPFRPMHYDMSQETDATGDESFTTAAEVPI